MTALTLVHLVIAFSAAGLLLLCGRDAAVALRQLCRYLAACRRAAREQRRRDLAFAQPLAQYPWPPPPPPTRGAASVIQKPPTPEPHGQEKNQT